MMSSKLLYNNVYDIDSEPINFDDEDASRLGSFAPRLIRSTGRNEFQWD
jgi:hypothetical protein